MFIYTKKKTVRTVLGILFPLTLASNEVGVIYPRLKNIKLLSSPATNIGVAPIVPK